MPKTETDIEKRNKYGMLCGIVGIFLNLILFAGKLFAGMLSGAISITADAFNNLSDAGSSIITIAGFKMAAQRADEEHPYGHARMEYVATLAVAAIILIMGFELFRDSFGKIIKPQDIEFSWLIVAILLASIAVKCVMAVYNFYFSKKLDSSTLEAPGKKTGTNVTGVSDLWPVLLQMETYAKFVPHAKKWGTIYNPAEVNSVTHIKAMRAAAKSLGLELVEVHVSHSDAVEAAANSLVGKVQAITITSDNTTVAKFDILARVCDKNKIALFAGDVDSVPRGAIAAYGMDYFLVGYSAGKKAALVLKGVKPGDIPWGPVEKFSLVINQKAARAQGITVSAELLKRADKVFE